MNTLKSLNNEKKQIEQKINNLFTPNEVREQYKRRYGRIIAQINTIKDENEGKAGM